MTEYKANFIELAKFAPRLLDGGKNEFTSLRWG